MARSYIELPSSGVVDMYDDVSMSFNYSIADIREPDKRDTTYSKTINIPGTKNNNKLFDHIFSIGKAGGFNPKVKTKAIVYVDTVPVFNGFLQLTNVSITDKNEIEYEVVIFGKMANIYTVWADDELRDVDFSSLNHTLNRTNIVNSYTSPTLGDGYVYPLIDYGYTTGLYYHTTHFRPAIYLKEYIDKLFRYAGYTYESDFFNSEFFTRLIVPFNGSTLQLSSQEITNRTLMVTHLTEQLITMPNSFAQSQETVMQFNSFITTPNPSSQYNTTASKWTVNKTGRYGLNISANTGIKISNNSGGGVTTTNLRTSVNTVWFILQRGSSFSRMTGQTVVVNIPPQTFADATDTYVNATANFTLGYENGFLAGDIIWVTWATSYNSAVSILPSSLVSSAYVNGSRIFYNTPNAEISEGETVDMNSCIPKEIKIRDFFTSIIKMFNLYVEEDKVNANKLYIEPREDFYADGETIDWTDKLDISRPVEINPMGILDAKDYLFTYKETTDKWNNLFKNKFGKVYGERRVSVENDFLTDTKKVEIIFSPTPTVTIPTNTNNSSPRYQAQIVNDDGTSIKTDKGGIRLLYFNDTSDCSAWEFKTNSGAFLHTTYPRTLHVDDAKNPEIDLSFGVPDELFYVASEYTNYNLYNVYWKKFIEEITDQDSKIVTGYFHLTPLDILKLDFRNKIFLDGHLYIINKVVDFNPTSDELTKVELLKLKTGVDFQPVINQFNTAELDWATGESGAGYFQKPQPNGNNYNQQSGQFLIGENNYIDPLAIDIIGSGHDNYVHGNTSGVTFFNSNNNVVNPNCKNVMLLNTSDVVVEESDAFFLDGELVLNGSGTTHYYPRYADRDTLENGLLYDDGTNLFYPHSTKGINKVLTDIDGNGKVQFSTLTASSLTIPVQAKDGGTGQTVYAVGDILFSSGTTNQVSLARLADVAVASYLRSGGVNAAPLWSTLKLPDSATIKYIPFATAANTWGESSLLTWDNTNLSLGVNQTAPTGFFYKGAVFGNNAATTQGITIVAGATKFAGIGFARNTGVGADSYKGEIAYNHNNDSFYFATAGTGSINPPLFMDASGYLYSATGFKVGSSSVVPAGLFDVRKDQNSGTITIAQNQTVGASAFVSCRVYNGSTRGYYGITSTAFSQASYNLPDMVFLESDSTNGLALAALNAAGSIIFVTGGSLTANIRGKWDASGRLGVGVTTPSGNGNLQVNAGTQINIISKVGGVIYDDFTSSGSVTTNETDLSYDPINGNVLATNGDKLEAEYGLTFANSATATRQVRFYFGGTAIFDSGALTVTMASSFVLRVFIIRVSSTVIRYSISASTTGASTVAYASVGELTGLTLSTVNIMKVTGTSAGVGAATNDIILMLSNIKHYTAT